MPRTYRPVMLRYEVTASLNWSEHVKGFGRTAAEAELKLLENAKDQLSKGQYARVVKAMRAEAMRTAKVEAHDEHTR